MSESKMDMMYGTAREMLKSLHVSDAMDVIEGMAREAGAFKELDEVNRLRDNYGYMLRFMAEGADDPHRVRMHKEMIEALRSLADSVVRLSRSVSEPDYYSSTLRLVNVRKDTFPALCAEYSSALSDSTLAEISGNGDLEPMRKKEELLDRLFSLIYTSVGNREDYRAISRAIIDASYDSDFNMQMVSALTLGLLAFYDRQKFLVLLEIYENASESDDKLAARALVGIVLVLSRYPQRIGDDEAIFTRMSLWLDSDVAYRNLRETVRAIISTRDTDRIASKLKDEVIPELMKIRPDIMKKIGEIQSDPDSSFMENNPEWEEMLDKSGLTKKMQELSDLQSDGADVMMVTFANLKQFPFFREASNWFLPFSLHHTSLSELPEDLRSLIDGMSEFSGAMPHSDMYSLSFAMKQLPLTQRTMMGSQFDAQMQQMREELAGRRLKTSSLDFNMEVVRSVRDLFRFFRLFRAHRDFRDPFENPLDFMNLPVVGEMMAREEMLEIAGEFYFKRGYYPEALPAFLSLSAKRPDDTVIYEKIGFCQQRLRNYSKAMEAYSKAELLHAPGPWLLRRIAVTAKRLGDFDKAAEYYDRCLDCDPENLSLIMSAGHNALQGGNVSSALAHYYHANYLQPDDVKILRALGWLELLNGNFAKSADFYARIPEGEESAADHLNRGHALMLAHDMKEAVKKYRLAIADDKAAFINAFEGDIPTLEPLGLDSRDAHILLDALFLE